MKSNTVMVLVGISLTACIGLGQACTRFRLPKPSQVTSQSSTSCETPSGVTGNPQTIEEAIALINALPKPVTVACFLQSLSRPLNLNLTSSLNSAQPAFSERSPRVFILGDALTISVVPEGAQSEIVEFGALSPPASSIKGELLFPVQANLSPDAAYQRILYPPGTACQFCHTDETQATDIASGLAFRSKAIRPFDSTEVTLESLRTEWLECDALAEPKACEILSGILIMVRCSLKTSVESPESFLDLCLNAWILRLKASSVGAVICVRAVAFHRRPGDES